MVRTALGSIRMKGFGKVPVQISGPEHIPPLLLWCFVLCFLSGIGIGEGRLCFIKISEFNVQTLRLRGPLFALSDVSVASDQQHTLAYGHRTKKYGFGTQGEEFHSDTVSVSVTESYHSISRRGSVYLVAWPSPRWRSPARVTEARVFLARGYVK